LATGKGVGIHEVRRQIRGVTRATIALKAATNRKLLIAMCDKNKPWVKKTGFSDGKMIRPGTLLNMLAPSRIVRPLIRPPSTPRKDRLKKQGHLNQSQMLAKTAAITKTVN